MPCVDEIQSLAEAAPSSARNDRLTPTLSSFSSRPEMALFHRRWAWRLFSNRGVHSFLLAFFVYTTFYIITSLELEGKHSDAHAKFAKTSSFTSLSSDKVHFDKIWKFAWWKYMYIISYQKAFGSDKSRKVTMQFFSGDELHDVILNNLLLQKTFLKPCSSQYTTWPRPAQAV